MSEIKFGHEELYNIYSALNSCGSEWGMGDEDYTLAAKIGNTLIKEYGYTRCFGPIPNAPINTDLFSEGYLCPSLDKPAS